MYKSRLCDFESLIQIQCYPFPPWLTQTRQEVVHRDKPAEPPNKCQLLVLCDICTASLKRPPARKKGEQIARPPHCTHTLVVQLTASPPSPALPWHLRPQFVGGSLLEPLENLSWEPHRSFIVLFHCRENHFQIGTDRAGWYLRFEVGQENDLDYSSPVMLPPMSEFQGCLGLTRINDKFFDQIQSRQA